MEPLTPEDPLWKVLGKAKPVQPRPDFVQNMVRLARQTPQEQSLWARVRNWWHERESAPAGGLGLVWAGAAALLVAAGTVFFMPQETEAPQMAARATVAAPAASASETIAVALMETDHDQEADFPLMPEFETEWKNLEQVGDLLAVHDTSLLTDSEINLLLY